MHGAIRCAVLLAAISFLPPAARADAARSGEEIYREECATCHENATGRIPPTDALRGLPTAAIVRSLETGTMRVVGTFELNGPERVAVAEFLTGKAYDPDWAPQHTNACRPGTWETAGAFSKPHWNGWGNGNENTRFQGAPAAGLDRDSVPYLELQWVFAFPGETIAEAQPTVLGNRLFVGSRSGTVYALDAQTGCVHWTYQADGPVKSSVVIGEAELPGGPELVGFFGDLVGNTYAVRARDGSLVWRTRVEEHPAARIMGSLLFAEGQVLVPMTSVESTWAASADAVCCTFRGSVTALDPATGEQLWKRHTIEKTPAKTGTSAAGVDSYGPAGASVWTTPTYDDRTRRVYLATSENYSSPPTDTSDAILAVDLDSSELVWSYQGITGDAWNMSCGTEDRANCPDEEGPDFDMGSSPALAVLPGGKRVLIASQKSGVVHALDPDREGALLWKRQIAKGGILGGIEWGPATDHERVYVAIADVRWHQKDLLDPELTMNPARGGGLVALSVADGSVVWEAPPIVCGDRPRCSPAQLAAVTAIPGVVFSGSLSGHLRAFDSRDGSVIWQYDTVREYETVNGAHGLGGALDGSGPVVANGWLYVSSGYSKWGGLPGNVLLAFAPSGS